MGIEDDFNSDEEALNRHNKKWQFHYDYLNDILSSDQDVPSKVQHLIKFKSTILFELMHGESLTAYKAISTEINSPKNKKEKIVEANNSVDAVMNDIMKPIFNSDFVMERIEWNNLLIAVEFAIYELTISTSSKENLSIKKTERKDVTKYSNSTLALLFMLLNNQKIIVSDKKATAFLLSQFTGISPQQLRKSFSNNLMNNETGKKFTSQDIKTVIEDLEIMLSELKKHIKTD